MGMCKFFIELLGLFSSAIEGISESRHIFVGASVLPGVFFVARDLPITKVFAEKR